MPEYAFILLLLFVVALFLHQRYKLRLFKSIKHMFFSYAVILSMGIVWDQYAIYRGHWSFGESYLLGPKFGYMPIEEIVFGIIMPYFGLVIYKLVEKKLPK